jgi:hypothetical protein
MKHSPFVQSKEIRREVITASHEIENPNVANPAKSKLVLTNQ